MNIYFNYKGQKFKAELSDNPRNARIAFSLMWSLVDDDVELTFMPKPKLTREVDKSTLKKLKKMWR